MTWSTVLSPVSYEDVARRSSPGTATWITPTFTDDELNLYYLFPKKEETRLALFRLDLSNGQTKEILTPTTAVGKSTLEEDLRRQRLRIAFDGISSFEVVDLPERELLLVNLGGRYLLIDPESSEVTRDLSEYQISSPSHISNTTKIAAVRDGLLIAIDFLTGATEVIASPSDPELSIGVAEYVAQEELDRLEGYWFSKDGTHLAYCEVDQRQVPEFPIVHLGSVDHSVEYHRYPFVGKTNAKVTLYVATASGRVIRTIETPPEYEYLSHVKWLDSENLLIQYLNRFQDKQQVLIFSLSTNSLTDLYSEEIEPWINAKGGYFLLDDGSVVTTTERSGRRHLFKITDGVAIELTTGDFDILEILSVHSTDGYAYLLTNSNSPLQHCIQRFDFATSTLSPPITTGEGLRDVTISRGQRWLVERFNNLETSAQINIYELLSGGELRPLQQPQGLPKVKLGDLGVRAPHLFTVPLGDGEIMYAAIYSPPDGVTKGKPVVLEVYGGPHFQMIKNGWHESVDMQAQLLAQNDVVVVKFDNRGSFGRGKSFESPIFRSMGTVELDDQVAGLAYVHERFETDPDRVGVFGWSYGGFMTLSLLAKKPELFRVGVAGAPVVDFTLYDTAYTERYMHTPETNPRGYAQASVLNFLEDITAPCLVIHGLVDENVHFRNTAQLLEKALEKGIELEVMVLPEARHMPTAPGTRLALAKTRTQFLLKALLC